MMMAERVARQEVPGQPQTVAAVCRRGLVATDHEGRQTQEPRRPAAGACRCDGAAGLWRHEGESRRLAGHGTTREIEPVAEIGQQQRFPAHQAAEQLLGL